MAAHRYCDGVRRRDFLKAGLLGGIGLTLADYLNLSHAGEVAQSRAKSAIFVSLGGGPSHMDTFDLKPNAGAEYRGEFNPIPTNVPGIEICEHLPKLAQQMDKFTILRGVSHTLAAHELGAKYMNSGNRPLPSVEYPGYGSVVSKELPCQSDLPPYVAIPDTPLGAGFLGIEYAPLRTASVPKMGRPFDVRGIARVGALKAEDVERRQRLLGDIDTTFRNFEGSSELLTGLDRFSKQAQEIIDSTRTREAFDVTKESPEIAAQFGDHSFGQSCMLAIRLIEAGVRFASVGFGGWDTHTDNFKRLKENNLPALDAGLSALFATLHARGMLESTVVCVTGEFGRTPKINPRVGRDHWPRAMFVLMAGGGIRGGMVLGESDANGMGPASKGISPDDVAASFYRSLGIDHKKEYETDIGRPIMIVRNGEVIPELFG